MTIVSELSTHPPFHTTLPCASGTALSLHLHLRTPAQQPSVTTSAPLHLPIHGSNIFLSTCHCLHSGSKHYICTPTLQPLLFHPYSPTITLHSTTPPSLHPERHTLSFLPTFAHQPLSLFTPVQLGSTSPTHVSTFFFQHNIFSTAVQNITF